jgi:hypothetical protein
LRPWFWHHHFTQSIRQARWNMSNPNLPRNFAIVPHRNMAKTRWNDTQNTLPAMSRGMSVAGNALAITPKQGTHDGADFGF